MNRRRILTIVLTGLLLGLLWGYTFYSMNRIIANPTLSPFYHISQEEKRKLDAELYKSVILPGITTEIKKDMRRLNFARDMYLKTIAPFSILISILIITVGGALFAAFKPKKR